MTDETSKFEAEAEAVRKRIAETIDDLQHRLSPQTLVNNAVGSITNTGSSAFTSVTDLSKAHPLVTAFSALAIGVALLARSKIRSAKIEFGDNYAAYADYDEGYAADLSEDDRSNVGPARARIDSMHRHANVAVGDNPLAVVLVGAATGALLGAIIPVMSFEGDMAGNARRKLGDAARTAVRSVGQEFGLSSLIAESEPEARAVAHS